MKDETAGIPIGEFVGLRSKLYALKTKEDEELKKAKGIKRSVVQKSITVDDYKSEILDRTKIIHRPMKTFKSRNHDIQTMTANKIALSGNDDKRYILKDIVHTLALGNYKI